MDIKSEPHISDDELQSDKDPLGSSGIDQRDMHRLGKAQELKRNFGLVTIIGFISILQAMWESTLLASYFSLFNGGTAGTIWLTFIVWLCFIALIASMAEMASMAPTAGGQYHWVSEFAPPTWEKPLSYVVGWCCCLGWLAGIPACAQICAGLVQGMVLLVYPNANISQLWQTTLIIFLFMVLTFGFNIFLTKYLPMAEGASLVLHIVGFLAFLITMWACGDHVPAKQVFTQFNDGGGWSSLGLSTLVGIASPLWFFIGPDAGAHMSEETINSSLTLPRAMFASVVVNGALGMITVITFCFCIPDINAVINTPTDQPILAVIYNQTGSMAAACVLGSVLLIIMFFATITNIATASRQCWAFARDRGFPRSAWIMRVQQVGGTPIPLNALYVCAAVSFILAAINFGSDVAFNAIVSVSNAALVFSYFISVGCLCLKRLRGETLLPRRWSLGRWGGLVNDISLAFLAVGFVFSFFPETPLVGDATWAADMNWAILMFAVTCLGALVYHWAGGRNMYVPPVIVVKNE